MTIAEMHVWFRQYATQMGMQNVSAITPEQIDIFINTSSIDMVDEVVNRNVKTTTDRFITDNAKLSTINALRTLYKIVDYSVNDEHVIYYYKNKHYTIDSDTILESNIALYFVDFSITYSDMGTPPTETRLFPIHVVDSSYLAKIINDCILSPKINSPVMVAYAKENSITDSTFDIYFGDNDSIELDAQSKMLHIKNIRMSYIKKPNKVKYISDLGGINVESDLPEQLHIPMLKHAVNLYKASMQDTSYNQDIQQNQQDLVRNNSRSDNDVYQS